MAYAVHALRSERANVARTHDEFPRSDLALAFVGVFQVALRFALCLLFFRALGFLPSTNRLSQTEYSPFPSSFVQRGACQNVNVKGVAVPIRHVLLLTDCGAYSREFEPLFSVRHEPHAFCGGDTTLRPQATLPR